MGAKKYRDGGWVWVDQTREPQLAVVAPPAVPPDAELLGPMTAAQVVEWIGGDLGRAQRAWEVETHRQGGVRVTVDRAVAEVLGVDQGPDPEPETPEPDDDGDDSWAEDWDRPEADDDDA